MAVAFDIPSKIAAEIAQKISMVAMPSGAGSIADKNIISESSIQMITENDINMIIEV